MASSLSDKSITKSASTLWLLLTVFVVPVIVAKCALNFHWLDYGVTNKGDLVTTPLTLEQLGVSVNAKDSRWLIMVNVPQPCSEHCLLALQSIHNTYIALGRERPRVNTIALVASSSSSSYRDAILATGPWLIKGVSDHSQTYLTSGQVLIVDPLQNIVLSYQAPTDDKVLAQFGKSVLADLKKLLKYSRIG